MVGSGVGAATHFEFVNDSLRDISEDEFENAPRSVLFLLLLPSANKCKVLVNWPDANALFSKCIVLL